MTTRASQSAVASHVVDPKEKRPAAKGMLRWAPVAAFGLLMLVLSRHAGDGISDPDTLWHVLAGDHLWRTGHFIGADPFSPFTVEPWALTQWLPDLAMSAAHHLGGLPAVGLLAQLGRLAVCVTVYVSCRRSSGPLAAAVITGVAVLGTAASLSPRPQLVGFALLAVTTSAWLRTAQDLRPRWWLAPLTWLWASSHGTWIVGLMLGLVAFCGLVLDRRLRRSDALRLTTLLLASGLAALITPLGPRIIETFEAVRAVSPYIHEWRRPDATDPSTIAFALLVIIVLAAWSRWGELRSCTGAGVFILGLGWGCAYSRSVAIGAIILAPLAARALDHAVGRARPPRGAEGRVVVAMVAITTLMCAAMATFAPAEPVGVPTRLADSLRELPSGTVVFNDDSLGGWIMWSLPNVQQTADTRVELYGPDAARRYLRAMGAERGWQAAFDVNHPDAALLKERVPLVRALLRNRGWTVVGRDRGFILLRPPLGD